MTIITAGTYRHETQLEPVSEHTVDDCDRCHKRTKARWYEDTETGAEWCYCDDCRDYYERLADD